MGSRCALRRDTAAIRPWDQFDAMGSPLAGHGWSGDSASLCWRAHRTICSRRQLGAYALSRRVPICCALLDYERPLPQCRSREDHRVRDCET
jgi:hypothetical protein